jgi:pimeloyl-ACP methyl ester carboxylesterase
MAIQRYFQRICAPSHLFFALFVGVVTSQATTVDPDTVRNFTQIVTNKGYPCEVHRVVTRDGYILTAFRIPHGRENRTLGRPVLLFHGLADSSFTWILNMPEQSLAYILADKGYDVWMGNVRGNRYSLSHTHLNPKEKEFWDFTFDEFAEVDVPDTIDYILKRTEYSSLSYIGHSQGTTMLLAAFNFHRILPINIFIGLGPVYSVSHQSWFLRLLADLDAEYLFKWMGFKQFLPPVDSPLGKLIMELFCYEDPKFCDQIIELICGRHKNAFNESRMPVMAAHEPGGTSVKNIIQWAQLVKSGKFQRYDYGREGNLKHYNSTTPPSYTLRALPPTLPVALFYGDRDTLADPSDVQNLIRNLPHPPIFVKRLQNYAHLDFCWCITAETDFYGDIINLLTKFT